MFEEKNLEELLTIREELNEAIKVARKEAKAAEKEAREEAKATADAEAKAKLENLEEGDNITVELKGEETDVTFVKVTEKRMIVEVEGRKIALPFRKYLGE
jgi:RNA 3'-terminal phosphate cyclase